jgi:hypothetical protein
VQNLSERQLPSAQKRDGVRLISERGADGGHRLVVLIRQIRCHGGNRAVGGIPHRVRRTEQLRGALMLRERSDRPRQRFQTQSCAQSIVEP